jgi:hypothetical protein
MIDCQDAGVPVSLHAVSIITNPPSSMVVITHMPVRGLPYQAVTQLDGQVEHNRAVPSRIA